MTTDEQRKSEPCGYCGHPVYEHGEWGCERVVGYVQGGAEESKMVKPTGTEVRCACENIFDAR